MRDSSHAAGPLKLQASLHETIWGGTNLEVVVGKHLPIGAHVGESWETEIGNQVVSGSWAGRTLEQVVESQGEALLGSRAISVFGHRFPLLAKFLDAQDQLSVQVHPNDEYARTHVGGELGKTEAWYILHTEPGAQLVYGLARETTEDEVRSAIADNRLEALLHSFAVHPGDVVFVPAGTVHAIGGGVVLFELQEYSDITYRLYDYGRLQANGHPRELHVADALKVMRFGPSHPDTVTPVSVAAAPPGMQRRVLVACRYFVLEEMTLDGTAPLATTPGSCEIISVLAGECTMTATGSESVGLRVGETAILPAHLGRYTMRGVALRCLRSYVPEEDDALLLRWRTMQPSGDGQ